MRQPPTVHVVDLTAVEKGSLIAFASVRIGPLTINKIRLIQQPGQTAWCSPPQESWVDGAGKKRFTTLVTWPVEWKEAINAAVYAAWQKFQQNREGGPQ